MIWFLCGLLLYPAVWGVNYSLQMDIAAQKLNESISSAAADSYCISSPIWCRVLSCFCYGLFISIVTVAVFNSPRWTLVYLGLLLLSMLANRQVAIPDPRSSHYRMRIVRSLKNRYARLARAGAKEEACALQELLVAMGYRTYSGRSY